LAGAAAIVVAARMSQAASASAAIEAKVYSSPTCGCCGAWVEHLEANGFRVEVIARNDLDTLKDELGVPRALRSCHTATIGGYVIEGHVPAADIKTLLAKQPRALGLAVPGMPVGSPGMEAGDQKDSYEVVLFGKTSSSTFARH
jgi:hypothetical protein